MLSIPGHIVSLPVESHIQQYFSYIVAVSIISEKKEYQEKTTDPL